MAHVKRSTQTIAFFDVDHTLIDGSTGLLVLRQMWKERLVSFEEIRTGLYYTLLYELGTLPYEAAIEWIYGVCGKLTIDELTRVVDTAYVNLILPRIFQEAMDCVAAHKRKGHLTCLATATSDYLAERIRAQVSADLVISNVSRIRDNRLAPIVTHPICHGEGKKLMAQRMADEFCVDLSRCIFYSDSASDLPLLDSVGYPVIVNPSGLSRWHKRLKAYRIVRWKNTTEALVAAPIAFVWPVEGTD